MDGEALPFAILVGGAMVVRRLVHGAHTESPYAAFHDVAVHAARRCIDRRNASAACTTFALPRSAVCQPSTMQRLALEDYDNLLDTVAANVKWGPYVATSGCVAALLRAALWRSSILAHVCTDTTVLHSCESFSRFDLLPLTHLLLAHVRACAPLAALCIRQGASFRTCCARRQTCSTRERRG